MVRSWNIRGCLQWYMDRDGSCKSISRAFTGTGKAFLGLYWRPKIWPVTGSPKMMWRKDKFERESPGRTGGCDRDYLFHLASAS